MKQRLRCHRRVTQQPAVVRSDTSDFLQEPYIWPLISSEIQETDSVYAMELREIEFIATNEIESRTLRNQRCCKAEGIGSISTTGEKSDGHPIRGYSLQ